MPEAKKATLKEMLSAEVNATLEQRPDLRLVKLADAAPDNWSYLGELAAQADSSTELIDFFHALSNSRPRTRLRERCAGIGTRDRTCYGMRIRDGKHHGAAEIFAAGTVWATLNAVMEGVDGVRWREVVHAAWSLLRRPIGQRCQEHYRIGARRAPPPFRIVYRRGTDAVQVVRVWRSERLLKLPGKRG